MIRMKWGVLTLLLALLGAIGARAQVAWTFERGQTIAVPFALAGWQLHDLNGDGRSELLLIGSGGEVRTWAADPGTGRLEAQPRGSLVLPHPKYAMLALADFVGDGSTQLVVLSRRETTLYELGAHGAFAPQGRTLARRARLRLRTNLPVLADIVQDVNGDGRPDLIVPRRKETEIWAAREAPSANTLPPLRKVASVAVDIQEATEMEGHSLSDRLVSTFSIPSLSTLDLNGDKRLDLYVELGCRRMFHMQRPDGSIPEEPDVVLDLNRFQDTSPEAALRPGRTLAGGKKASYRMRDLTADGIPDYVIAHRRKVWVFHGNKEQPQFTDPANVIKVSDNVTALLLLNLDDDPYPDLLIVKLQIPTVATLLVGALKSFEIDITALGYKNENGARFSRAPAWRSELHVRLPSIVGILKNPGALLDRVEQVARKFRPQRTGDLDGDGRMDTVLLSEDKTRIDVWRGHRAGADGPDELDTVLRRLLFEEADKNWDIERLLGFFDALAGRRAAAITGGGEATAQITLLDPKRNQLQDFALGDLDGDGRAEIVVHYLPVGAGTDLFEIWRAPRVR